MKLQEFRNIPFTPQMLDAVYPANSDLQSKAERLTKSGNIIRLRRGLYVVSPSDTGVPLSSFLIANHIYGPSYVSMESALRFYGLIPETVHETISVCCKATKVFENQLGKFRYIHAALPYYSIGITTQSEENVRFLIATPEKAICDLISYTPKLNLRSKREVLEYLTEYLRIDLDDVLQLDPTRLESIAKYAKKSHIIYTIIKLIQNGRNVSADVVKI